MLTYVRNVVDSLRTVMKGMGITFRNLRREEITLQYPDALMELKPGYRGIHTLDQETCIYCFQCAKICPVDCIEMEADRVEKKFLSWQQFSLDYNKCLFCDLCVEVCPKDCIHMDRRTGAEEFALISDDRSTLNLDLLTWRGLSEADIANAEKAKEERLVKEAEKAAKAAAKAAEAKGGADAKAKPDTKAKPDAKAEKKPPAADDSDDKGKDKKDKKG